MDNLIRALVAFCIAVYALFPGFLANGAGEVKHPVDLKTIFDVWRLRQNNVHSFKFSWDDLATIPKGALSVLMNDEELARTGKLKNNTTVPPRDELLEKRIILSVDGDSMRYEFQGPIWSKEKERFVESNYISAFDGKDSKFYWPQSPTNPRGTNLGNKGNQNVSNIDVKPLLWMYRFFSDSMNNARLKNLVVTGQRGILEGATCAILKEVPKALQTSSYVLWVDMEKDCAIRRVSYMNKNKTMLEINIDYIKDAANGWVPSAWVIISQNGNESFQEAHKCTVTCYSINNSCPSNEFQIEYAPGTIVTDVPSNTLYITTSDGDKRVLNPAESRMNYSKQLELSRYTNPRKLWGLGLVLIIGLFFLVKWIRKSRKTGGAL